MRVTRHEEFEVAHILPGYPGGCGRLHGHSYKIEVTLLGQQTGPWNMVVDFSDLKRIIKNIVPDHKFVYYENDKISTEIAEVLDKYNIEYQVYPFMTTAENMVKYYAEQIQEKLPVGVFVDEVKLWETTNSYATWRRVDEDR